MKKTIWTLPVCLLAVLLTLPPCFGQAKLRKLEPGEKERLLAYRTPPSDVGGVPDDAVKTKSGLAYKMIEPGSGDRPPGPNDLVEVHFSGWNTAGVLLESSHAKNQPWNFQVNRAAPGVAEALQKMRVGGKSRLWLSPDLAEYQGRVPEGMVVYELELLSLTRGPAPPADLARVPEDAIRGMGDPAYRVLKPGRGQESPGPDDKVLIEYTVWTPDGKISASSRRRGNPEVLAVKNLAKGAIVALSTMVAGERREVWIPQDLEAEFGAGVDDVVWDLELIAVLKAPSTPPDVAAVPKDAKRTASGLAYKVLHPGDGTVRPRADETVVIYYASWTSDGELIDSSHKLGRPMALKLDDGVPAGMTEALQMMVEGEKRRIWIPTELGFKDSNRFPEGTLVFEVDLLKIES